MSKSAYFRRKEESLVNALIHTAFRAGSLPIQNNIDKKGETTQCFDIEKFEYLDRQSGYIQFEVIARTSFHPRERAARDIFGLNQL